MFRASLSLLMALLIFAAHAHCRVSHGSSLQRQLTTHRGEPAPAGEESSCENEFGCICKGAVLMPVQLELPADVVLHYLAIEADDAWTSDVVASELEANLLAPAPHPPDGEMLRAQLQVFRL